MLKDADSLIWNTKTKSRQISIFYSFANTIILIKNWSMLVCIIDVNHSLYLGLPRLAFIKDKPK